MIDEEGSTAITKEGSVRGESVDRPPESDVRVGGT